MSSVSSTSSTTNGGVLGDAPPVSFPGVASGIDYDAIIEKYTAETLAQETPIQAQVTLLNAQNAEILKIKNLVGTLQDSLTSLSNPDTFTAFKATPSNTASGSTAATLKQIAGQQTVAGTYTINAQTTATATTIINNSNANAAVNPTAILANAGTAITPTNGTSGNGAITINGVKVSYDVTTQSLATILGNIQAQVPGVTYTINGNGTVTLSGVNTLGSGADSGNLEQVLKLDSAPLTPETLVPGNAISAENLATTPTSGNIVVNGVTVAYTTAQSLTTILANINTATGGAVTGTVSGNEVTLTGVTSVADSGGGNLVEALNLTGTISGGTLTSSSPITTNTITSSSAIGGINETDTLGDSTNAGFATAVTSGTFTINGVQFSVNTATDSLSDLITKINASSAGVVAQYNASTSQITLTSTTPGPQSILLGATADTSNFLTAAGLKTGTTTAGTQASVTYTDGTGTHTAYSSTNSFTNVIPGFTLSTTSSSPTSLPAGSTYYTVSVAADPSAAETAINSFIKSYNSLITELNKDTVAPQVSTGTSTSGTSTSSETTPGGILYGNFQISELQSQLVSLVSGFIPNGSSSYNSLQSVGILLNTSSQSVGTNQDSSDSDDSTQSSSFTVTGATDGTLAALDTTTFEAAYAANNAAVASLFTLAPASGTKSNLFYQQQPSGLSYQLGTYLSNVNGLPTFLANSSITPGSLNDVLLTQVLDSNEQQVTTLNQQIATITQEANTQADQLRAQFTASETQIAELQALQEQISAIGH